MQVVNLIIDLIAKCPIAGKLIKLVDDLTISYNIPGEELLGDDGLPQAM